MDTHPQTDPRDDGTPAADGQDELEARRGELRAAVKRGLEDIEEGRVDDLGAALDRIEAMLDELEAAKKA